MTRDPRDPPPPPPSEAKPSVVIYGPQGCGKTRDADSLMRHFGQDQVIEADESQTRALPVEGALYLTSSAMRAQDLQARLGIKQWHYLDAMADMARGSDRKRASLREGTNYVFTSGDPDAIPVGGAERRYVLMPASASNILHNAASAIEERAAQRDQPDGERSMARAAAAFNALGGPQLSEVQGWIFMGFLKAARATGGGHCLDDYTDGAAYFALAGEAAEREAAA